MCIRHCFDEWVMQINKNRGWRKRLSGWAACALMSLGILFTLNSCVDKGRILISEEVFASRMAAIQEELDLEPREMVSFGRHMEPFPSYVKIAMDIDGREERTGVRVNLLVKGKSYYELVYYSMNSQVGFVEIRHLPGNGHRDVEEFFRRLKEAFPGLPVEVRVDGFDFDLRRIQAET